MWRAFAVVFFSVCALVQNAITISFARSERRLHARAAWLHGWCRFACRVLGIRVTMQGSMPSSGLLVSNHLSYLDIVVLSSIRPCVFVAKRDVASWPLFGWLAQAAGTIFVDRRKRLATREGIEFIRQAIRNGALVVVFPEGTSSDGATVLPFKSALLEPALDVDSPIAAAAIDYSLPHGGSVADEVCYWRDMALMSHLLNLFTKRSIDSSLTIASSSVCACDRKELARKLHHQIVTMRS
jgi:1-acyl-sn-glycerol-3-phosphate acyltransferase